MEALDGPINLSAPSPPTTMLAFASPGKVEAYRLNCSSHPSAHFDG